MSGISLTDKEGMNNCLSGFDIMTNTLYNIDNNNQNYQQSNRSNRLGVMMVSGELMDDIKFHEDKF